jgi:hypothetical protein
MLGFFNPVSKFICRRQQHDYSARISSSALATQNAESISLPTGAFLFFISSKLGHSAKKVKTKEHQKE